MIALNTDGFRARSQRSLAMKMMLSLNSASISSKGHDLYV
jgi:hypothetical protein